MCACQPQGKEDPFKGWWGSGQLAASVQQLSASVQQLSSMAPHMGHHKVCGSAMARHTQSANHTQSAATHRARPPPQSAPHCVPPATQHMALVQLSRSLDLQASGQALSGVQRAWPGVGCSTLLPLVRPPLPADSLYRFPLPIPSADSPCLKLVWRLPSQEYGVRVVYPHAHTRAHLR